MKDRTEQQLRELQHQGISAGNELRRREYEKRDRENAALVGKTFRYRNSYGTPDEGWWLYGRVTGAEDGNVNMFRFQTDCHGRREREPAHTSLSERRLEGWKEIPADEFEAEWRKLLDRLHAAATS